MFPKDPIYGTSILCKINPKNPGCGGGKGGNGGGKANNGNGGGNEGGNGGGNGADDAGVEEHPVPDERSEDGGNGGDNGGGNGGDNQGGNQGGNGAAEADYSAEGIAKRKQAILDAIKKNVPGLELTPDDLVPVSV